MNEILIGVLFLLMFVCFAILKSSIDATDDMIRMNDKKDIGRFCRIENNLKELEDFLDVYHHEDRWSGYKKRGETPTVKSR